MRGPVPPPGPYALFLSEGFSLVSMTNSYFALVSSSAPEFPDPLLQAGLVHEVEALRAAAGRDQGLSSSPSQWQILRKDRRAFTRRATPQEDDVSGRSVRPGNVQKQTSQNDYKWPVNTKGNAIADYSLATAPAWEV